MTKSFTKVTIRSERPNANLHYADGYDQTEFLVDEDSATLMISKYNKDADVKLSAEDPKSLQKIFNELSYQDMNSKRSFHRTDRGYVVALDADLDDSKDRTDSALDSNLNEWVPEHALIEGERAIEIFVLLRQVLEFLKKNYSKQQLDTFLRITVKNLPQKDVAAELGISDSAISQQVKHIREKLLENFSLQKLN